VSLRTDPAAALSSRLNGLQHNSPLNRTGKFFRGTGNDLKEAGKPRREAAKRQNGYSFLAFFDVIAVRSEVPCAAVALLICGGRRAGRSPSSSSETGSTWEHPGHEFRCTAFPISGLRWSSTFRPTVAGSSERSSDGERIIWSLTCDHPRVAGRQLLHPRRLPKGGRALHLRSRWQRHPPRLTHKTFYDA
jgi:hypothetical protein